MENKQNILKSKLRLSSESGAGFTIIELLVVVAIIAVLTGIVLANVTVYINRGKDSAAKGDLSTMVTNGAVWYDGHGSYTNFSTLTSGTLGLGGTCTGDPTFTAPCQAIVGPVTSSSGYNLIMDCSTGGASVACNNVAGVTNWCAQITLKQSGTPTFCVDSNGNKKSGGTCTAATGVCG